MRAAGALVLACALAAGWAVPAAAHEINPNLRTVLDGVEPATPGLEAEVHDGIAAELTVRNRTGRTLVVLGVEAEPFLRIGPDGAFGNVRSPTLYLTSDPEGLRRPPEEAGASAPPVWRRLSREPEWSWFEHRAHKTRLSVPPEVVRRNRRATVLRWEVDARLDGEPVRFLGHIEWLPPRGGFRAVLERVTRPARGLEVRILYGRVPALFVRNATGRLLEVPGLDGEPFLRIGPRGVEANLRSPTWYRAGDPRGVSAPPPEAVAGAVPVWESVASEPQWAWLEYRAAWRDPYPPDEVLAAGRRATVLRFDVPATLGGEPIRFVGRVEWLPPGAPGRGGAGRPAFALAAAALAAGLAASLLRRRRRAARPGAISRL